MSPGLPLPPFTQPPPPGLFQVRMGSELAHSPATKIFPLARAKGVSTLLSLATRLYGSKCYLLDCKTVLGNLTVCHFQK